VAQINDMFFTAPPQTAAVKKIMADDSSEGEPKQFVKINSSDDEEEKQPEDETELASPLKDIEEAANLKADELAPRSLRYELAEDLEAEDGEPVHAKDAPLIEPAVEEDQLVEQVVGSQNIEEPKEEIFEVHDETVIDQDTS